MAEPRTAPTAAPVVRRPASWSLAIRPLDRLVSLLDDAADRLWSSRLNPLHQSGTIAALAFATLVASGVYLFLFYSIDAPWESVSRIEHEVPGGGWARTLHTYAADLAVVATALHALKMLLAGRSFGARARAWLSGVVLLGIALLCGWTGQVMAWDRQGQVVAVELTKLLDLLPVFSMPMSRAFDGLAPVASSFFFMNLFLHVCLPLGLAVVLWVHLSRLGRPQLLPPKPLLWTCVATLVLLSVLAPVTLAERADLLAVPRDVPIDLALNFWLPFAWRVSPGTHALAWLGIVASSLSVPWWWRRSRPVVEPSWVEIDHCTGCTTCYKDCPFDAITMVPRVDPGRRSEFHALVSPERCVSCGICAGSCAPMSVGPPGRTGREQMKRENDRLRRDGDDAGRLVVFACAQNEVAGDARLAAMGDVAVRTVGCVGELHTSVIDLVLRSNAAGVYVLGCAPRSAPCREGAKWLHERVYNDREAELPKRVDKRRIELGAFGRGEWSEIEAGIDLLRQRVAALEAMPQDDADDEIVCDEARRVVGG